MTNNMVKKLINFSRSNVKVEAHGDSEASEGSSKGFLKVLALAAVIATGVISTPEQAHADSFSRMQAEQIGNFEHYQQGGQSFLDENKRQALEALDRETALEQVDLIAAEEASPVQNRSQVYPKQANPTEEKGGGLSVGKDEVQLERERALREYEKAKWEREEALRKHERAKWEHDVAKWENEQAKKPVVIREPVVVVQPYANNNHYNNHNRDRYSRHYSKPRYNEFTVTRLNIDRYGNVKDFAFRGPAPSPAMCASVANTPLSAVDNIAYRVQRQERMSREEREAFGANLKGLIVYCDSVKPKPTLNSTLTIQYRFPGLN